MVMLQQMIVMFLMMAKVLSLLAFAVVLYFPALVSALFLLRICFL